MAFISMIFAFLFIAVLILGVMFLVGLVLLIAGIVLRRNPKISVRKASVACTVSGSVLLGLPIVMAAGLCMWGVFSSVKGTDYESVPDRWKNEWVMDSQAEDEIMDALFTSADSGDREAFVRNFTPELQGKDDFIESVDAFFDVYPKGFSYCETKDEYGGGGGSYNAGHNVRTHSLHFNTTIDGEWYYVSIEFCYENTDEPDKVGVTNLRIMNLQAAAVFFDECSRSVDRPDDIYLLCDIRSSDEISARLIGGQPFLWTPTDTSRLTADELRDLLKQNKRLDSPALSEKLGAPNAFRKYVNSTGYDYYYELADRNGEPCYANIETDSPYGEIFHAFICTPTDYDYDYTLFDDGSNE